VQANLDVDAGSEVLYLDRFYFPGRGDDALGD
jgi:hypothetical protein